MNSLIKDKTYRLVFPDGVETIAILHIIETYPATGMSPDYFFKYVSGDRGLVDAFSSTAKQLADAGQSKFENTFPLPEGLLPRLKSIEEVK